MNGGVRRPQRELEVEYLLLARLQFGEILLLFSAAALQAALLEVSQAGRGRCLCQFCRARRSAYRLSPQRVVDPLSCPVHTDHPHTDWSSLKRLQLCLYLLLLIHILLHPRRSDDWRCGRGSWPIRGRRSSQFDGGRLGLSRDFSFFSVLKLLQLALHTLVYGDYFSTAVGCEPKT